MLRFTLSQGQSLTCLCIAGRRSNPQKYLAHLLCRCSQAHSTLTQREPGLHAQATGRADSSRIVADKLEERRESGSKASSSRSKSAAPHIPVLLDEVGIHMWDRHMQSPSLYHDSVRFPGQQPL